MITNDRGAIERSAVATLLYFDIFNHPLTVEETFAFLPQNSITIDDLRAAIADSHDIDRHTADAPEMLLLRGRPVSWISGRSVKELYAARLWRRARRVAWLIACFPFVRGLFVTGSLSKNAVAPDADIDWFIVTEPHRLWVCKTLLTIFRRMALFNSTKYFCTNYYISADSLEIPDRNVFIATEIATAQPLLGTELAGRFFAMNAWIREYLPNAHPPDASRVIHAPIASRIRRVGEYFFRGAWGDWLDARMLAMHQRYERRKHPGVPPEDFAIMFRARPDACKIHKRHFQRRVIEAYEERLQSFGVTRKTKEL